MIAKPSASSRRAARSFAKYKEDVKKRGKPFFPYAMFHDTVMSLVVVRRDHRAGGDLEVDDARRPHGHGCRLARPLYSDKADPGTTSFVPAPRLVLLLPLLPAADLQVAGLGDPGNGRDPDDHHDAAAPLPFVDTRRERRLSRRPVAVVVTILDRDRDGDAHLQGRDRQGGARLASSRCGPELGEEAGLPHRRGRRARSCSPNRAASPATRIWAQARPTSVRPTSRRRARRARGSRSRSSTCTIRGRQPRLADAVVRVARRREHQEDRDLPRGVEGAQVASA